jgi:hypothetical protein
MTHPMVGLAALDGTPRPELSPLLGYASFMLVVVITLVGIWLLVRVASSPSDSGEDDGGDGGERGGGPDGGGGGTPPGPGPRPEGDPDWWPEFERAFAAHVNGRLTRSP